MIKNTWKVAAALALATTFSGASVNGSASESPEVGGLVKSLSSNNIAASNGCPRLKRGGSGSGYNNKDVNAGAASAVRNARSRSSSSDSESESSTSQSVSDESDGEDERVADTEGVEVSDDESLASCFGDVVDKFKTASLNVAKRLDSDVIKTILASNEPMNVPVTYRKKEKKSRASRISLVRAKYPIFLTVESDLSHGVTVTSNGREVISTKTSGSNSVLLNGNRDHKLEIVARKRKEEGGVNVSMNYVKTVPLSTKFALVKFPFQYKDALDICEHFNGSLARPSAEEVKKLVKRYAEDAKKYSFAVDAVTDANLGDEPLVWYAGLKKSKTGKFLPSVLNLSTGERSNFVSTAYTPVRAYIEKGKKKCRSEKLLQLSDKALLAQDETPALTVLCEFN